MNAQPAAGTHEHRFDSGNPAAERGTRIVMWITLATMVVEIGCGWWFNSMALLADGWHMSSHAVAIGLAAYAYAMARRLSGDERFAFGTWKIEILGGFASAMFLLGIVALMVTGSIERLLAPQPIRYLEAMAVAIVGLAVNIGCALILGHAHAHDHDDEAHHHAHGHTHRDLNLESAYVHVVADAATSVLAIAALAGGWAFGWAWLDPAMGLAGAVMIGIWAVQLLRRTGTVLLDREMDHDVVEEIRTAIDEHPGGAMRVTDLHVWRVGRRAYACAIGIITTDPALTPDRVRALLAIHDEIVHSTIEIHHCRETAPHEAIPAS